MKVICRVWIIVGEDVEDGGLVLVSVASLINGDVWLILVVAGMGIGG